MNIQRVRRAVSRMLHQFDSETVQLLRPVRDEYGQPTGELTPIGEAECWREMTSRPDKWNITESGARYEDEGVIWLCLLWSEQLPAARHEDICRFADGTEYSVKNVVNKMNVRVFWQLADRRNPA